MVAVEIYYRPPVDAAKEALIAGQVASLGGRLDCREGSTEQTGVCVTYGFDDWDQAIKAAETLRLLGEHVEGPMDYAA